MKVCVDCNHCIKPKTWTREKELLSENTEDLARCAMYIKEPEKRVTHLVTGDVDIVPAEHGFCYENRYSGECGILGHYFNAKTVPEPVVTEVKSSVPQPIPPKNELQPKNRPIIPTNK